MISRRCQVVVLFRVFRLFRGSLEDETIEPRNRPSLQGFAEIASWAAAHRQQGGAGDGQSEEARVRHSSGCHDLEAPIGVGVCDLSGGKPRCRGPGRKRSRPPCGAAVTRPSCGRPVRADRQRSVFRWTTDDTETRLVGPCPRRRAPVCEAPPYLDLIHRDGRAG
jgi:hypothetical protein